MAIDIDLTTENVNNRKPQVRQDFVRWLSERGIPIEVVEAEATSKHHLDEAFGAAAIMDIEMEAAGKYARRGDMDAVAYILANAKVTKDFVYEKLMSAYGRSLTGPTLWTPQGERSLLETGVNGSMAQWRDYLMERFENAIKACELHEHTGASR